MTRSKACSLLAGSEIRVHQRAVDSTIKHLVDLGLARIAGDRLYAVTAHDQLSKVVA